MVRILLLGVILVVFSFQAIGQEDSVVTKKKINLKVLPFAFFLPQTSLGFGGIGIATLNKEDARAGRPSQVLFSAAYTLENQLLLYLPYQFYFNNEDQRLVGEVGYYRYFYNFYGLGSNSLKEDKETYRVNFPRIYSQFMTRIKNAHFLGIGFKYDFFDIVELEEEGNINQLGLIGKNGGSAFMGTVNYLFDNRDNDAFPLKGSYIDVELDHSFDGFLSEYSFTRLLVEIRNFQQIKGEVVWANHLFFSTATSKTPFYYLPRISTSKIARGFDDRRFVDQQISNLQSELRFPLYKRIKGVSFLSVSNVGNDISSNSVKLSGGVGFRYVLNEKDKTRVRIDFGVADEGLNFYFTIREAF